MIKKWNMQYVACNAKLRGNKVLSKTSGAISLNRELKNITLHIQQHIYLVFLLQAYEYLYFIYIG